MRAGLDGSRVFQRGPTMVYVHDFFLNESEVAHLRLQLRSMERSFEEANAARDTAFEELRAQVPALAAAAAPTASARQVRMAGLGGVGANIPCGGTAGIHRPASLRHHG